ncbi:MAG TPA: hypothetical protein DHV48_03215 [Prolixibacteraceae bacterium]|nr:hypothetical protein [Prolixibacteraceae bacterium]
MKMKKLTLLAILAIGSVVFFTGCKNDDYEAKVGVCPLVVSSIPIDKAIDVPLTQIISATFNEKMDPETINQASFIVQQGTTAVVGTIAYNGLTATFTPSSPLLPNVLYSGTIKTLAKDLLGQALQADYKWSFTTIAQITLTSNPTAGGTTTGAGTFAKGASVTVNAIPGVGYAFTNWTLNGTPVSTTPSYQFTMDGNKALVANFAFQFAVALSSNPAEGGITTGAGSYTAGSNVTVTATPNTNYTFVNWTEGLTIASTLANYTFPLNASRNLVANFTANTYTLNTTAVNGTVLKVPSKTAYNSGEIVVLTATPATGYTFTGWTGDATGTINPVSVTMNSNKNVTANFTAIVADTYTLNVTAVNGTVLKVPSKTAYNSGEIVVLTATPAMGYTFTGWTGDATGTINPVSVTMNSNKNVTANFTANLPNTYSLNVIAVNGTVLKVPNKTAYNSGDIVQLTATANSGFKFTGWSGDANGTLNPLSVTMNADKNITANFIEDVIIPVGPIVNLNTAGDFSILTKSGISSTGITSVQGDIGVSPAAAAAITGFGLIMDTNGQTSHTTIATHVTGKVYAADYAPPTPSKLTVAVLDMETAYTTANNLVTPAPVLEQGAGNLSGLTLAPGLYKWSTGVLISSNSSVTLSGGANDTWVFQIAQDLTLLTGAKVNLIGGAQAKNITWVVAGQAVLGSQTELYGTIMSKTLISLNTGSKVTGRLLAQTAVTLNASTVVAP